jgi:putative addiction module killer protein
MKNIKFYDEKKFYKWINKIDSKSKTTIIRKIKSLSYLKPNESNNIKTIKTQQFCFYELKIYIGPGYRIYFSYQNNDLVLILSSGDKKTQKRDIEKSTKIIKKLIDT